MRKVGTESRLMANVLLNGGCKSSHHIFNILFVGVRWYVLRCKMMEGRWSRVTARKKRRHDDVPLLIQLIMLGSLHLFVHPFSFSSLTSRYSWSLSCTRSTEIGDVQKRQVEWDLSFATGKRNTDYYRLLFVDQTKVTHKGDKFKENDSQYQVLIEDFLAKYAPNQRETNTPSQTAASTLHLFGDIRRHRIDISSMDRKNFTINQGMMGDMSSPSFFKSKLSRLVETLPQETQGKVGAETVEIVDEFRFIINEQQLQEAIQWKTGLVSRNVGAKIDRGLEQSLIMSPEMVELLATTEQTQREDGKLIYRLEMDHDDLIKYTQTFSEQSNSKSSNSMVSGLQHKQGDGCFEGKMHVGKEINRTESELAIGHDEKKVVGNLQKRRLNQSSLMKEVDLRYWRYRNRQESARSASPLPISWRKRDEQLEYGSGDNRDWNHMQPRWLQMFNENDGNFGTGNIQLQSVRNDRKSVVRALPDKSVKHHQRPLQQLYLLMKRSGIEKGLEPGLNLLFLLYAIAGTAMAKAFADAVVLLAKRAFSRYWFFQRRRLLWLKFLIASAVFLRLLFVNFFDDHTYKT